MSREGLCHFETMYPSTSSLVKSYLQQTEGRREHYEDDLKWGSLQRVKKVISPFSFVGLFPTSNQTRRSLNSLLSVLLLEPHPACLL